jgi:hypothetical protein
MCMLDLLSLARRQRHRHARTHAHARALCRSPSLPPLSCTCLVCESGAPRMQLEPQLLASQRGVAQTSTDSVVRDLSLHVCTNP